MSPIFKVIETSDVSAESLERILNDWTAQGWRFEMMQFAMRDSSKRPAMAFVTFGRALAEGSAGSGARGEEVASMSVTRRVLWTSLLVGAIASLFVSFRVATQSIVIGSPEGNWAYGYRQPFTLHIVVVFAQVAVPAFALCAVPSRFVRRYQWWVVLAWLLVGLAQQGLLRSLTPFSFEQIFASNTANSFYSPTRQYSAAALLTDFARLRRSLPLHAQSNMPGKLVLVSGLRQISTNPAVMAWLVAGEVVLLSSAQHGDASAGNRLRVPGDAMVAHATRRLRRVVRRDGVCADSFRAASIGHGAALWRLDAARPGKRDMAWTQWLWQGAVAVMAFAAVYALFVARFDFDLFETLREAHADAAAFNVNAKRPYQIWVRQNLLDFGFGVGVCQTLVFCAVLGDTIRRAAASRRELARPIAVLGLGLAGVLLVTDLLGLSRGEVTRLWIFLACFFQIPAAYACARLQSPVALIVLLGTTLLQSALGTAMIDFIVPGNLYHRVFG